MAKTYKLSAKNFQSWRDFSLPMTGFTVIIGPSDRGKSAIIRALRGVLRNQVGANHITYGEKDVSVSLENDFKIQLCRNNKTTTYTVGEEEFSKLAGTVPPIVEAMKFNEVEVNGVKLDPIFAGQFDSQFMLDLSPAELNSIFGLFSSTEKLNSGKKNAASKNLEFNATAKYLASEIQEAEAKNGLLLSLKDSIEELSKKIFNQEDSYNFILTSLNLLFYLRNSRSRYCSLREIVNCTIPQTDEMVTILNIGRGLVQYSKKKATLDIIKASAQIDTPSCKDLDSQFQTVIRLGKMLKLTQRVKFYKKLPTQTIEHDLTSRLTLISKLSSSIELNKNVWGLKSRLESSNKQIEELTQELIELQGSSIQCPKCGHFFIGEPHGHE